MVSPSWYDRGEALNPPSLAASAGILQTHQTKTTQTLLAINLDILLGRTLGCTGLPSKMNSVDAIIQAKSGATAFWRHNTDLLPKQAALWTAHAVHASHSSYLYLPSSLPQGPL